MSRGSLTVVGTGIKFLAHVTQDTPPLIEQADVVIYGVADPATIEWIRKLNPNAESLCGYLPDQPRRATYERWVERILECVRADQRVVLALFGHPGVFVYASHESIRRARAEGYRARMLPGISAEDCLFADLGLDPYLDGCQSYEATDFLVRPRAFDTWSGLILWQVASVGQLCVADPDVSRERIRVLADVLAERYGPKHEVVVYRAAALPVLPPMVRRLAISELAEAGLEEPCTLYVPPRGTAPLDAAMVERLGIPADHAWALERPAVVGERGP